jgi:hypothetical protein
MSLTKLPLGRNNSVMTSLFPPRESLVVTSRLGTGNSRTFFLRCSLCSLCNIMDSFNEMHGFCYEFQAAGTVCYSITAYQTSLLVGSVFVDVNFMTMLRSRGNIHYFFSSVKSTLIISRIIVNLPNY